jgi:hypothetical protein
MRETCINFSTRHHCRVFVLGVCRTPGGGTEGTDVDKGVAALRV